MRTQVRWLYCVIVTIAVLAALQRATAPTGVPDPVLEAKFESETLIVTLTNRGTGPLEYPLRGYAESASDLDSDQWAFSVKQSERYLWPRYTCGTNLQSSTAWLEPGRTLRREVPGERLRYGDLDGPIFAEVELRLGGQDRLVRSVSFELPESVREKAKKEQERFLKAMREYSEPLRKF